MKKKIFNLFLIMSLVLCNTVTYGAYKLEKKEDAAQYSTKNIFSQIISEQQQQASDNAQTIGQAAAELESEAFKVVTAVKSGNTYTNTWSNYSLTFQDGTSNANEYYDFFAEGMKFDFGVAFNDYSRIAVYYTRLSRDLETICRNFAPNSPIDDVVIAEEVYKHVHLNVQYPYGFEQYDFYFRNVEGKLMVIELYYEDGKEKSRKYINEFTKAH